MSAQYWAGLAGGDTGRLFLTFGGPVRADRISNCPLDRVLTYKNLIYFLNLQVCFQQSVFLILAFIHSLFPIDLFTYMNHIIVQANKRIISFYFKIYVS